jgi:hypothetical protein
VPSLAAALTPIRDSLTIEESLVAKDSLAYGNRLAGQ